MLTRLLLTTLLLFSAAFTQAEAQAPTAALAHARTLTEAQRLSDLNQFFAMVEAGYGPIQYKESQLGVTIAGLRAKYEPLVRAPQSNGEFYYLMKKLVAEFKDGHFNMTVPTDHLAQVGILTDLVEGRVLIESVDRAELPESTFPYVRGDEIVSVDGVPTQVVLDELSAYVASGTDVSIRRSAAMAVFYRAGRNVPVPKGSVTIEIRRGTSSIIETVTLKWKESGTPLDEALQAPSSLRRLGSIPTSFDSFSTREMWLNWIGNERFERSFRCSGSTRIDIPKDATVLMKEPFVAYYHPTHRGNVGYLRIPHYSPLGPDGKTDEKELRLKQYQWAVRQLEANTIGLIIDQDHNCGGSVYWLESMLGLFMNKPYQPMQFQLLANKQEYLSFKKEIDEEYKPNTDEHDLARKALEVLKAAWLAGDFMTKKMSLSGEDLLYPSEYAYTKPIVMLIDEMSGSGGDAFPAMMQGYGRATLVGTHTAGLGGHVTEQPALNYSQLQIRMTKSLFFRPDGVPVENNGAIPDIEYRITRDDFVYGYKNYQKFYLKTLLERIP